MSKYKLIRDNEEIILETDNLYSFANLSYDYLSTLHDILNTENANERKILLYLLNKYDGFVDIKNKVMELYYNGNMKHCRVQIKIKDSILNIVCFTEEMNIELSIEFQDNLDIFNFIDKELNHENNR